MISLFPQFYYWILYPQKKRTPTILVIEDDLKDSALITKTLVDIGYSVETALSGAAAIKACEAKQFDVITLDLLLEDMNGWDLLRAFRSRGKNLETPTVVVTVVESKAASFGFIIQNFLIKPIRYEDLIIALQRADIYQNQSKSILFVDDDPKMLTLCAQYLKDYGSIVLCESDPEQGLSIAELKRPDVIVLDLLMSDIDGLEFLRRFRLTEHGKKTPIIICTSQDITDIDRKRLKASVAAVVQKGSESMTDLIVEIKRICPIPAAPKIEHT